MVVIYPYVKSALVFAAIEHKRWDIVRAMLSDPGVDLSYRGGPYHAYAKASIDELVQSGEHPDLLQLILSSGY